MLIYFLENLLLFGYQVCIIHNITKTNKQKFKHVHSNWDTDIQTRANLNVYRHEHIILKHKQAQKHVHIDKQATKSHGYIKILVNINPRNKV